MDFSILKLKWQWNLYIFDLDKNCPGSRKALDFGRIGLICLNLLVSKYNNNVINKNQEKPFLKGKLFLTIILVYKITDLCKCVVNRMIKKK